MENLDEGQTARLIDFRREIHASFPLRADVLFETVDSLLYPVAPPKSAVQITLSPAFRRKFSSLYDALSDGSVDEAAVRQILFDAVPTDAVTIGGFAIYPLDTSAVPRDDAETMAERTRVYDAVNKRWVDGVSYVFLGRAIEPGTSWLASVHATRVVPNQTFCEVAADQVLELDKQATAEKPCVVPADSNFTFPSFLKVFASTKNTYGLIRIANNRVLFAQPGPDAHGNCKHGSELRLSAPTLPDRLEETEIGGHRVRLRAWHAYHFKKVASVSGMVVCVEYLRPDGTPRYKRPLWLFWTGSKDVALSDLARIYHLRFTIEHFFRFLKDRFGLLALFAPNAQAQDRWVWLILLAYWHLLLARRLVSRQFSPWYSPSRQADTHPLTPGQVLNAWPAFSGTLGTEARPPQLPGKGTGRQPGFHPKPRMRRPVQTKKPIAPKKTTKKANRRKGKAPQAT